LEPLDPRAKEYTNITTEQQNNHYKVRKVIHGYLTVEYDHKQGEGGYTKKRYHL
jgi:hypothetical protein